VREVPEALQAPEALVAALQSEDGFAIIPHLLPDVDALGSAEGLCRILRAAGKTAAVHVPDLPAIYAWAIDPGVRAAGEPAPTACRIAVDTARANRLQVPGPVRIGLDHHEDNPGFATQVDWVQAAPSCSCLLPAVARALGVEVRDELATALYRGLVGDTECFRTNLSPAAFAWAEYLLARGADGEVTAERFWQRSAGFWRYLGAVEEAASILPGRCALRLVPIPASWPERYGLPPYENALLPGHLAPPPGGVLAILQEGSRGVRFRLRSRGRDVLPLAHALGGGGHPQAAGVVLTGVSLPEAEARLRQTWAALG